MAQTRKTEYPVHQPRVFDRGEFVRKQIPSKKSGLDVVFESVSSKEISDVQLDPRVVDLEQCIASNQFIEPRQVQEILNMTDPEDIDKMVGKLSEETFSWLKQNMTDWDFEKNVKITPSVEPEK